MAYTTIDNPELYFQTKLYTGNGSNSHAITFDGDENMQPDWVWIKDRGSNSHRLTDSVRGATKVIYSDLNFAEATDADTIQSFDSNGFTLDDDADTNGNGQNFASWNWKAGTSFSNDASATGVGSIDSTGSINTTAGFSIISYTGNGSGGATVGHGLGVTPNWIIVKNREATENWRQFHHSLGNTFNINLSTTNAKEDSADMWNDTSPTSSVFTIGTNNGVNKSGDGLIAYCFAEKKGYSKFGSYTGNGNADGPFIYTGFRPAWVLQKNADASQGWQLQDNKRDGFNGANKLLQPHTSQAESDVNRIDILSNGFKVITTDAGQNSSGTTYIFMAFAESPFVNSNGVPCNAR